MNRTNIYKIGSRITPRQEFPSILCDSVFRSLEVCNWHTLQGAEFSHPLPAAAYLQYNRYLHQLAIHAFLRGHEF
jgi:hypothetical protein